MASGGRSELSAIARLAARFGPPPAGEVWVGDDAAVVSPPGPALCFASDAVVEGVHFDRRYVAAEDVGWKALAANVSDMAAMGARSVAAVASVAGASGADLEAISEGLAQASAAYACPIVGGDLSDGPALFVSVAIIGTTEQRPPVLRSGARPGDALFVTGPLGLSAAGRRLLVADPGAVGEAPSAHLRPRARPAEGLAAARAGARAMIDVSDGLAVDLGRLAAASGVGVVVDHLPVGEGATEEEALGGGEDYELCFSAGDEGAVGAEFAAAGLRPPIRIGGVVEDRDVRQLFGRELPPLGYLHDLR